jgi:hypothetical protein
MGEDTRVWFQNSPSVDAFSRLRVSEPFTIFDSKQVFDNQPLFWDESLETGAGITSSHSTNTATTTLTSSANTAGKFTRQTFQRFNYQPGKSMLVYMTGSLQPSGTGAGLQRRIGLFDDNNGFFFSCDEDVINVTLRSKVTGAVVDDVVAQADWNVDSLDGTGPSHTSIDFTKAHIWVIDYTWLGLGRIRMGVYFNGDIEYCHEFRHDNDITTAYTATPNLPLRFQMISTAASEAATMTCICATVISEGGHGPKGGLHYASTDGSSVTCTTENVVYALIGIRLKSAYIGEVISIEEINVQIENQSKDGEWLWILNPTVADTFTYADYANSAVQIAKGATANTVTGGTRMEGGYAQSTSGGGGSGGVIGNIENGIHLGAAIDGTLDTMVLCWVCRGGTSGAVMEGAIAWRELE